MKNGESWIAQKMRKTAKRVLPNRLQTLIHASLALACNLFSYKQYDSTTYWKKRASANEQTRVLWQNEEYNNLYRSLQRRIIRDFLIRHGRESDQPWHILDMGCGIGIVARILTDEFPDAYIDAVDFPEMISIARRENPGPKITYIESSGEDYHRFDRPYDFILSSACISAIRDIGKMEQALDNLCQMCKPGGLLLFIDPFHRWNYLARAKYSSRQIRRFVRKRGFTAIFLDGVLFWPTRVALANSRKTGVTLVKSFHRGERWRHMLGPRIWADYRILGFRNSIND